MLGKESCLPFFFYPLSKLPPSCGKPGGISSVSVGPAQMSYRLEMSYRVLLTPRVVQYTYDRTPKGRV